MEKYFIVTEESPLFKDYFAYKENREKVRLHVCQFEKEHGIETNAYPLGMKEIKASEFFKVIEDASSSA